MNFIEKSREIREAQAANNAKARVAVTATESNPNRARINAKLEELKASIQNK